MTGFLTSGKVCVDHDAKISSFGSVNSSADAGRHPPIIAKV